MEKLFTPNKVFVFFCGMLIAVWLGLQYVSNSLLMEIAKKDGESVFDWYWPTYKLNSQVDHLEAHIVNRSATDAVVSVEGKQQLAFKDKPADPSNPSSLKTEGKQGKPESINVPKEVSKTTDCKATLTYYHTDKYWVLGKVELQ
jgi:hypothetical protein